MFTSDSQSCDFKSTQILVINACLLYGMCELGAVASWLVHSSRDGAVQVQALAGDFVLSSWARHVTLTVPPSIQVYKWKLVVKLNAGGPCH